MKRVVVALSCLFAIGTSAATAADMPVKAKPAPVVLGWTGFYIGGELGGVWGHEVGSTVFTTAFSAAGSQTPADISGFLGGFEVGYNYQLNPSWVIGVNADWAWTNTKGSTSRPGTFPGVVEFGIIFVKWYGM